MARLVELVKPAALALCSPSNTAPKNKDTMKKTYEQLQKQIKALEIEAEKLRRVEMADVVEKIRGAIAHYGLTAADLGLTATAARSGPKEASPFKRKPGPKKGSAPKGKGVVKYRHESGGTWGGIGKRPQWLRDELAAGKRLEDFLAK